jgi:hypothetical protein
MKKAVWSGIAACFGVLVMSSSVYEQSTGNIPLNTLQRTATGTGYQGGSSDSTTPQTVGTWTGSGHQSGSHTYTLPNSWSYATGTYDVTLNYTLATP